MKFKTLIKGLVKDFRTYLAIFLAIVFISGIVGGWVRIPVRLAEAEGKIEVNEDDIDENEDAVQSLANTVEGYIQRQDVAQAQREKNSKEYRELMLRYIDKK